MVYLGRVGGPKTSEIFPEIMRTFGCDARFIELYAEGEEWSEACGVFTPVLHDENGKPYYKFTVDPHTIIYEFTPPEIELMGDYRFVPHVRNETAAAAVA